MIRREGGSVMSKLMWVSGVILITIAVLLGATSFISPGRMLIYGLTPETAALLLVGGILSLGLGSVINALAGFVAAPAKSSVSVVETAAEQIAETPTRIPGFGRKTIETVGAATVAAVAETASPSSAAAATTNSVADTIAALEQAKSDIKTALGGVESMTSPEEHPEPLHVATAEPADEAPAEGELYVVEEKIIRGRPSRILSDDTVEAETDEGWMRFENLEHLNEYLDSMEPSEA